MDDTARAQLHQTLIALEAELQTTIAASADRVATVDLDQPIGRLSRMDAMQAQQMAKAERRRINARLVLVRAAMVRYNKDPELFGTCLECGDDIAPRRLHARPECLFCVPCAQAREGAR